MSKKWLLLRGDDLSAFIEQPKGPSSQLRSLKFIEHVSKYGTQNDFNAIFQREKEPLPLVFSMLKHAPVYAHQWIIDLLTNRSTEQAHFTVLIGIARLQDEYEENGLDSNLCHLLSLIDHKKISAENREIAIKALLMLRRSDIIDQNFDVYEQAILSMKNIVISAAYYGYDIKKRMKWAPTSEENIEYFAACCAGNLLQRAKECAIDSSETKAISMSLAQSVLRRNEMISEYLWKTFPHNPWHETDEVFGSINFAGEDILTKIVHHFQQHAPEKLSEMSVHMVKHAIFKKNTVLFDALHTFIDSDQLSDVLFSAINKKNKQYTTKLLKHPSGERAFMEALGMCSEEDQAWATNFHAKRQKDTLGKHVNQHTPAIKIRKM